MESDWRKSMNNELFVGNLSFTTSEQDLASYFEAIGPVESTKVIKDHRTGRSRGFGFVKMVNEADAKKAIADYDGKDFSGRTLKVNIAGAGGESGGERRSSHSGGPRFNNRGPREGGGGGGRSFSRGGDFGGGRGSY